MLARDLHGKITCFSLYLHKCKEHQDVTIGGKITRILDMSEFVYGLEEQQGSPDTADDEKCPVYLALDDSLGNVNIVVTREPYEKYKHHIALGNVILVQGFVQKVKKQVSVMAYNITPLIKHIKGE